MSMHYLGKTFDIHTGGVDLTFPHHENEIAQSEGATKEPFVRYWLHNEHFLLDGKKISKSLGNVISVPDLLKQGYCGELIRYVLISPHYRTQFNFTMPDSLVSAREAVMRVRNFYQEMGAVQKTGKPRKKVETILRESEDHFNASLDDDLNIPEALGAIFSMIREINIKGPNREEAQMAREFLQNADKILAILEPSKSPEDAEILKLIEERNNARKNKDFKRADEIRKELDSRGIILKDSPEGTRWTKA